MTDQHPLTDEEITNFAQPEYGYYESDSILGVSEVSLGYNSDALRAAADWQLERVIEWLNETIFERSMCQDGIDSLPEELEKAMRPQQQEDN